MVVIELLLFPACYVACKQLDGQRKDSTFAHFGNNRKLSVVLLKNLSGKA